MCEWFYKILNWKSQFAIKKFNLRNKICFVANIDDKKISYNKIILKLVNFLDTRNKYSSTVLNNIRNKKNVSNLTVYLNK